MLPGSTRTQREPRIGVFPCYVLIYCYADTVTPRTRTRIAFFYITMQAGTPYFHEYYNLVDDPNQLNNSYAMLPAASVRTLTARLNELRACAGASCR